MSSSTDQIHAFTQQEYKYGFVTEIETDSVPAGLNEDVIRLISAKKHEPQFMLDWRLKAYRNWTKMVEPNWANVHYPPIDYQGIVYYSAPTAANRPKSLDEVDPELIRTYEKLGIPLKEQAALAGVAVDAVFDSVSVATTFKEKLGELGIIFGSFSEAVQNHPELVREVPRVGRSLLGQLLRCAELGGLQRRLVLLRAEGRALPDGAVDVLPH